MKPHYRYERTHIQTHEVVTGPREEICELDKRLWSDPVQIAIVREDGSIIRMHSNNAERTFCPVWVGGDRNTGNYTTIDYVTMKVVVDF